MQLKDATGRQYTERLAEADKTSNYAGSTHIGKLGVEASYEDELHGEAGIEEVEVTAGGRAIRSLSRKPARSGNNLRLSLDIRLQKLVENWFGDQRGALVASGPAKLLARSSVVREAYLGAGSEAPPAPTRPAAPPEPTARPQPIPAQAETA